ncbi:MAG: hypothetical protein BZY87_03915 [SAR202 cluster bacterium Io17-Chloro-G6]|nr:MAG: hypothetical protein BZY87_03915 [SAR202 cluster bacterium Io17-Chloro-G6]
MSTSRDGLPPLDRIETALAQLGYTHVNNVGMMRFYWIPESSVALFLVYDERMTYADLDVLLETNGVNLDAFYAMMDSI